MKLLDEVTKSMEETIIQMRFHKNLVLISCMLPIVRLTRRLVGESAIPQKSSLTSVFGETTNEEDIADRLPGIMITKHFNGYYESLIYRDLDKAKECAEQVLSLQNLIKFSGSAGYHRIL